MLDLRAQFRRRAQALAEETVTLCQRLVQANSTNPPGDTRAAAAICMERLAQAGIEVSILVGREPIANVVARVRGRAPGRRLAFNGHLDTGPVPQPDVWTVPPFGGILRDGRLYGRGVSDMKAGVAAMVMAAAALASVREHFSGEAILALVGDEGSGGTWGTRYVLESVPDALGDALLSADVGSTGVARFGEKGYQWIELRAQGRAAGGAHPHLGINAADILLEAVRRIQQSCAHWPVRIPSSVRAAVLDASRASEALSGEGETASLLSVTATLGILSAGTRPNLVPAEAFATFDIRFPPGLTRREVVERCQGALSDLERVELLALDGADPNWTNPGEGIVQVLKVCAAEVLGRAPALSLRLGFSDARIYREKGIPAIVLGATPHNTNAPDEYVDVDELKRLFLIHATAALIS